MSYGEFDETKMGLSIASMVLGILGIIFACLFYPLGFILGFIGLILAAVALHKKQGSKGMAITGLVLGILSIAFGVLALTVLGALLASIGMGGMFI